MSDSYVEKLSQGVLSKEEQRQAVEAAGHKYYYTSGQDLMTSTKGWSSTRSAVSSGPGECLNSVT